MPTSEPSPHPKPPARRLELEATIYTLEQLRDHGRAGDCPGFPGGAPQVALAGRSNVGKSTLINALAGSKKLAKTSSTPGKTRSVNIFRVLPDGWKLVDLPGYGYARASKTDRAKWAKLIEAYLTSTPQLKAVAMLLDCRLPPQQLDLDLAAYLANIDMPLVAVLTKADKCKQAERGARAREWKDILSGYAPVVVSAKSRLGLDALWAALERAALGDVQR